MNHTFADEVICNNCGQIQETTYKELKMNPLKIEQQQQDKSDLSNCKIGDYIYTCSDGWVKITDLYLYENSLVTNTNETYTLTGKKHHDDEYPSAWTVNPFDTNDKPPCEFKKGEEVLVWRDDCSKKRKRIFSHVDKNKYYCYDGGQTEWTSGNSVTGWNNCVINVNEGK